MDTTRAGAARARKSRDLLPYQAVMAVTSAGVGGIVAVLGELRTDLGFSTAGIGMMVAAGFLAGFVAQVTLASLADRGHARRMVVSGVLLALGALVVMSIADHVVTWIVARAVFGFAGGMVVPGVRRAAAVADPERVGENLGRLVMGEISGFLLGPIASGVIAQAGGIRAPFIAFAVLYALFLPFAARLPADNGQIDTSGRRLPLDLLGIRRLQGALVLVAGYFGFVGAFEAVIPVMYADRGATALTTGLVFSTFAVPIVLLGPRAGRVADRVGPSRVATLGIATVATSAAFYGFLPGYIFPAMLMGVAGVGDAFGFTAVQVTVARSVPEDRQASALGLMGATEVLAAGVAAVPAAVLYHAVGARWMWLLASAATLAIVAVAVSLFLSADRGDEPGAPDRFSWKPHPALVAAAAAAEAARADKWLAEWEAVGGDGPGDGDGPTAASPPAEEPEAGSEPVPGSVDGSRDGEAGDDGGAVVPVVDDSHGDGPALGDGYAVVEVRPDGRTADGEEASAEPEPIPESARELVLAAIDAVLEDDDDYHWGGTIVDLVPTVSVWGMGANIRPTRPPLADPDAPAPVSTD